ncbi:MAG: hypothetical protein ACODAJ_10035, partial [Planctomycetota bacterium]
MGRIVFGLAVIAALLAAPASAGWVIGINNNSHAEMEQEGGGRNDHNFYVDGDVDYSAVAGLDGRGADRTGLPPEPWRDAGIEGFPRALTSGFTTNNIFFDLPDEDGRGRYRVDVEFFTGRGGSTHDLAAYWNASSTAPTTPFAQVTGLGFPTTLRAEVAGAAQAGPNVLSVERTGGTSGSWITLDWVRLTRVPITEVFRIGFDDNTQG